MLTGDGSRDLGSDVWHRVAALGEVQVRAQQRDAVSATPLGNRLCQSRDVERRTQRLRRNFERGGAAFGAEVEQGKGPALHLRPWARALFALDQHGARALWRDNSIASVKPAGPAPTLRTPTSAFIVQPQKSRRVA